MQTVQVAREADGLASSYHIAYLVGAVVAGIGIVAAGFVRSGGNGPQASDAAVPRAADELPVLVGAGAGPGGR